MREEEVKNRIGKGRCKEFEEFMKSQTAGINKDGSTDYYKQDVEDFLRSKRLRFWD